MNEQLLLRYQDNFTKIINEKYRLDDKMYNFDDYDIEDFKLGNLDFYYKDGRQCKILDYNWAGDGKYTYVNNIVIRFDNGEIKEDVSGMALYLTEESLKNVLEHCFGDKDYFEYMEMEYESIFD